LDQHHQDQEQANEDVEHRKRCFEKF
jgi:hypothetical protein